MASSSSSSSAAPTASFDDPLSALAATPRADGSSSTDTLRTAAPVALAAGRHYFDLKALSDQQASSSSSSTRRRASSTSAGRDADRNLDVDMDEDAEDEAPGAATPTLAPSASRSTPRIHPRRPSLSRPPSRAATKAPSRPASPSLNQPRPSIARMWSQANSAAVDAEGDNEDDEDESRLSWLARLHALSDEQLCDAMTIRSSRQHPHTSSSSLARELSKALSESSDEVHTLNEALERLTSQFEQKLELQRRTYETRETAMRSVCAQHGVPAGAIDRAIARAVADMPRVSIKSNGEAEMAAATKTLRGVPPSMPSGSSSSRPPSRMERRSGGGGGADRRSKWIQAAEANEEEEPSLPFSLQEAMLDDLAGNGADSATPTSARTRSSATRSNSSHSVATTSGSIHSRSARRASAKATEGLMGWRQASEDRKSSATTQATSPAAVVVEAEGGGYLSASRSAAGDSAFSVASSDGGKSDVGVLRHQKSMASIASVKTTASSSSSVKSSAPSSRTGSSSFFASLAWRRKKPNAAASTPPALPSPIKTTAPLPPIAASNSHTPATTASDVTPSSPARAPSQLGVQPLARTSSGGDVVSALHEAISGSADSAPSTKHLPKPPHVKAVFLATRILGPDSSNLLSNRGRQVARSVAEGAQVLVENAREDELEVGDETRDTVVAEAATSLASRTVRRRAPAASSDPSSPRITSPRQRPVSMAFQAASAIMDAAARSASAATTGSGSSTSKRTSSGGKTKTTTPNVTRVPQLGGGSMGRRPPLSASQSKSSTRGASGTADDEPGAMRPPVELDAIVPLDGKPPTLAVRPRAMMRPLSRRVLRGPQRGDDGDASSGDEFEVYGGKGMLHIPEPINSANSGGSSAAGYDDRAVDVFGFVYDATPSDVRLLRQARKASTPAPACLTGVRVGVAARGSDGEDEGDDSDEGETSAEADSASQSHGNDSSVIISESTSNSTKSRSRSDASSLQELPPIDDEEAGVGGTVRQHANGRHSRKRLLGKPARAEPSTEATSLVASRGEGPTSPEEERRSFNLAAAATSDDNKPEPKLSPAKTAPTPTPKPISETIKSLLDQLKVMHAQHQAEQTAKWDDFIASRKLAMQAGTTIGPDGSISSSSAANGNGVIAIADEYQSGVVGYRTMSPSDRQRFLLLIQSGIPLAHRAKVWLECSGATEMAEPGRYQDLLEEHADEDNGSGGNAALSQIDLDIHRTMPTNIYFGGDGPGVAKLRRVLAAYSWHRPDIGYCQGMNNLAATLLLTHASEEEAFWVLACLLERILPDEYYTAHLVVAQADQRVLIDLVEGWMPKLKAHMEELGVDLPAVTFAWFLSLYTDCLPVETLFRVWDLIFVEGTVVLFRVALAILSMNEAELMATASLAEFYGHVHSMTSRLFSVDRLVQLACNELRNVVTEEKVVARRKVHVGDVRAELGLDIEEGGEGE